MEIPITISNKPPAKPQRTVTTHHQQQQHQPEQIQSKLTDLNKLNLELDQLVSREEKLFELENSKATKSNRNNSDRRPIRTNPFGSNSTPDTERPVLIETIKNQADSAESGFDLIKVSIVNKRPVSPDLDEIINGSDEETYLDRSLNINEDFNKRYDDQNKRLSSLDPSLSYECENQTNSRCSSINQNTSLRVTNPFSSDVNSSFRSQYSSSKISPATSPLNGVSKTNPFRENLIGKRHIGEQLINVEKLNNYKYQYEIHPNADKTGVVKIKDISMSGVSTPQVHQCHPCGMHSPGGSKISVHTDIHVDFGNKNPFKEDVKHMHDERQKRMCKVSTIEKSVEVPHVVERRFYSEEELKFKEPVTGARVVEATVAEKTPKVEVKILRERSRDKSKSKSGKEKVKEEDAKEQKGRCLTIKTDLLVY